MARELRRVTLEDALALCLILRHDEQRYQRATARWLARHHAEVDGVTLTEIREVTDLLAALPVFGAATVSALVMPAEQGFMILAALGAAAIPAGPTRPRADAATDLYAGPHAQSHYRLAA